ncbi:hypothetical protein AAT19DRAFT_16165 [Rhodotorula toruloides]|uniref:Uncharacterized protein n=1 Tax=Rhodotorula toruloides TaxID=5286 RepID=A0A2T0A5X3_RHOTO|nr:hypothetical protein AAT19DRAFT_16165 [Rhodotorula toruloides]
MRPLESPQLYRRSCTLSTGTSESHRRREGGVETRSLAAHASSSGQIRFFWLEVRLTGLSCLLRRCRHSPCVVQRCGRRGDCLCAQGGAGRVRRTARSLGGSPDSCGGLVRSARAHCTSQHSSRRLSLGCCGSLAGRRSWPRLSHGQSQEATTSSAPHRSWLLLHALDRHSWPTRPTRTRFRTRASQLRRSGGPCFVFDGSPGSPPQHAPIGSEVVSLDSGASVWPTRTSRGTARGAREAVAHQTRLHQ